MLNLFNNKPPKPSAESLQFTCQQLVSDCSELTCIFKDIPEHLQLDVVLCFEVVQYIARHMRELKKTSYTYGLYTFKMTETGIVTIEDNKQ